jgi:CAAX prenyl protease-like protein
LAANPTKSGFSVWFAYVAPFATFLAATQIVSLPAVRPYYPWTYTAMAVMVSAVCLSFRKDLPPLQTRGLLAGAAFGAVGVVVWIALANLGVESLLRESFPFFALISPERVGYDPFQAIENPLGRWAFLCVRFLGLAVLVPFVEEIFWRGFLMRYLISEQFTELPQGAATPVGFVVVTLLFALVHPELLAAAVWGAGINLVWVWTRNLWACVAGHAVTNLLLGLYVVYFDAWRLW